jgi:hypothetical protein
VRARAEAFGGHSYLNVAKPLVLRRRRIVVDPLVVRVEEHRVLDRLGFDVEVGVILSQVAL